VIFLLGLDMSGAQYLILCKEYALMPTIVRKSFSAVTETRREIRAVSWSVRSTTWNPPTDLYETEENCVIKVEIAGMRDEDFEVAFENNILVIQGNRPDRNEKRAYHQMEIRFGRFEIAVEIPVLVDIEKAIAEYKDGFLVIMLPKVHSKQERAG
jgi:HSP20 family protein